MQTKLNVGKETNSGIALAFLAALSLAGCGRGGPSVNPQTIRFSAPPTLALHGNAIISATASSGLTASYSSLTPTVCSVDGVTGVVTDITAGNCVVAADQAGSAHFAPAAQATQRLTVIDSRIQTISFSAAPALTLYSLGTASATASSGLAVSYSSITPGVCSVNSSTGVVTDIAAGACIVAADQPGDINHDPAPQVTQAITIAPWTGPITAPAAPAGITATAGNVPGTVTVSVNSTASGGSPITAYTVTSSPAGITATNLTPPFTVTCPAASCSGYAFSVIATNGIGSSTPSAPANVVTSYNVTATFVEPMTQPNDSIFIGTFTLDSTTNTVSNLQGSLTESMTGTPMATVPLAYQLSAVPDGLGGLLVTTFALNTTNTFYGGGFAPGSGAGIYYGFPTAKNPASGGTGNAYAMIYVNLANPTAALTPAQLDRLAYADCTMLGMMGDTCMTGTSVAGYGTVGTMSGYPVSQTISKR